jgi:glycosyltransferase involved in cell wall biosynthesis
MALTALKVRGPFRGATGYDHHVREFVRALHAQGVAIQLVDMPEWSPSRLPPAMQDSWFAALRAAVKAPLVLHFCMPHQVKREADKVNVNYTMFEATRVPSPWVAPERHGDLVVLPTDSSRSAWVATGFPEERIRLCPLGVDRRLFGPVAVPLPLQDDAGVPLSRYATRFLNVSAPIPRKNLAGLLRVWWRATSRADDAVLILKLGATTPQERERFDRTFAEVQREIGQTTAAAAPVLILDTYLPDADIPRLYAAATHYLSLSFGEGWDQPMLEAAASGLELVAPEHSAYTAYLNGPTAHLIPSETVPVRMPPGPDADLFRGASWWAPDEEAAIAVVRSIIAGQAPKKQSLREQVLRDLTWEAAARRLIAILSEEVAAQPRGPAPLRRWYRHVRTGHGPSW